MPRCTEPSAPITAPTATTKPRRRRRPTRAEIVASMVPFLRASAAESNQTIERAVVTGLEEVWGDREAAMLLISTVCVIAAQDERRGAGVLARLAQDLRTLGHSDDVIAAVTR